MVQRSDVPFNVSLLELTPAKLQGMRPVTSLDIFDGAGSNMHPDGLFSTLIFGKVGDDRRSTRFSFIDIKIPIFHPVIYRALVSLKRLYGAIISGQDYAVWNPEIKDFERGAQIAGGQTGYAFFVSHWREIEFGATKSVTREQNILMIKKYQDIALTSKVLVLPAGLRDIELTADGRTQKDEINNFYYALLSVANTVSQAATRSPEMLNSPRYRLQMTFNELYDTMESMIQGKKKLLMGKWASRRINNGTRNVITAMDPSVPYLGAPGSVTVNHTVIGLYQLLKSLLPVARYHLRTGFLSEVFTTVGAPTPLVNKQTLRSEDVYLSPEHFDRWMTNEGLEKVITAFGEERLRHMPLEIDGHYLGLVYKGPDATFRLMHSIDELPEGRSAEHVHPMTFCELLYLSCYHVLNRYPIFVTRYPVTGVGSIYPSKVYAKTTIKSEVRAELDERWEPRGEDRIAREFPVPGPFVNSLVPHPAKLDRMGADFDGDMASGNTTYSDESVAEVDEFLGKKRAYVGTDGQFLASTAVSTTNLVLFNMTGD